MVTFNQLSVSTTKLEAFLDTFNELLFSENLSADAASKAQNWLDARQLVDSFFTEAIKDMRVVERPIFTETVPTVTTAVATVTQHANNGATTTAVMPVTVHTPTTTPTAAPTGQTVRASRYNLYLHRSWWDKLSTDRPTGKILATHGFYIKRHVGGTGRTIVLANAVTNPAEYEFIPFDRNRGRISIQRLAKALGVTKQNILDNPNFSVVVNGPHSLLLNWTVR